MKYNWKLSEQSDGKAAEDLARQLNLKTILARLLVQRGFDSPEKAKSFFFSSLNNQHDPFLMDGMSKAVDRVFAALERYEKIMVYGDYDVDGATSAAVLAKFLRQAGSEPLIHIPDRIFEGYGPNSEAIRTLAERGTRLLVTVDCGTTSIEPPGSSANANAATFSSSTTSTST